MSTNSNIRGDLGQEEGHFKPIFLALDVVQQRRTVGISIYNNNNNNNNF